MPVRRCDGEHVASAQRVASARGPRGAETAPQKYFGFLYKELAEKTLFVAHQTRKYI